MKKNDKLDRLMRYIEDEMTASEKAAFESDLEKDEELNQLYKDWNGLEETTDWLAYEGLKDQMKSIAKEEIKVVSLWRKPLTVAASILLLIVASLLIYAQVNYSDKAVAQAYYEVPNFTNFRNTEVNTDAARVAFLNKDYLTVFSILESQTSLSGFNQYLLAHAYFNNGDYGKSQALFMSLTQSQDERYVENAQWYAALSYLKDGKEKEGKQLLIAIAENDRHAFADQAGELLLDLESTFRIFIF